LYWSCCCEEESTLKAKEVTLWPLGGRLGKGKMIAGRRLNLIGRGRPERKGGAAQKGGGVLGGKKDLHDKL